LGVIRKTLPADLAKIVIKEIPKDVIGQGVDKIQSQLVRAFALR
jgi:protein required for attachment to host cells